MIARVLPEVAAIDKVFDYLVPDALVGDIAIGTMVRIELHGRRVGGWVVGVGSQPPPGVALRPLAKVTGHGPAADLIDLARWAAWRWAGRAAQFLSVASPPGAVRGLPPPPARRSSPSERDALAEDALAEDALAQPGGRAVLRLPPAADLLPLVAAAARRGTTLVVCPSHTMVGALARSVRGASLSVAVLPGEWARAAAGPDVVLGARGAAWGPVPHLAAVVVLDEHDEAHQQEGSPTWHARDVAAERARRAGVPCVLTSSSPSLEALDWGPLLAPSRSVERAGWPVIEVVDRRQEDPRRADLYSSRLVDLVRSGRRVVCVLNRKGRVRLLACASCGELARCEACAAPVEQQSGLAVLRCRRCGLERPVVCASCGAGRLKSLRLGVNRVQEDLERLAGVPVAEVTADTAPASGAPSARVLVGTEAVLHRAGSAEAVAFLDFDQELLAPRYRAAEQAMAMLARAARLVGGREGGGRVLVQTRMPDHEVVTAGLHADPARVVSVERDRRLAQQFPPVTALAEVGGAAAEAFVAALPDVIGLEVLGPADGRWLLRAPDHGVLCDVLAATPRPSGRLRLAVDPPRV